MANTQVRLGSVYLPQFPPERIAATARAADNAGLNELWLWEDCFLNGGISGVAIALANSVRLTIGIGVLPIPMRNVAVTAMEIATLQRAFPDRVRVGMGHGVQDWMKQVGVKVSSPMTLMREHFSCLVALLSGESVDFEGKYVSLKDVSLAWPPTTPVELLLGAVGPRTLQLSGELADGTILTQGMTPNQVRDAIAHIQAGRTTDRPHSIVNYLLCATGEDADGQMQRETERWGFDVNDDIHATGNAAAIATAARRWIDAGVDTVVLQPPVDVDVEGFVEFVGSQVRPLL